MVWHCTIWFDGTIENAQIGDTLCVESKHELSSDDDTSTPTLVPPEPKPLLSLTYDTDREISNQLSSNVKKEMKIKQEKNKRVQDCEAQASPVRSIGCTSVRQHRPVHHMWNLRDPDETCFSSIGGSDRRFVWTKGQG